MNRFLTKRKAKRAGPIEPKVELDLAAALPTTDNFRTSLLMPNLSARFSMLREQDDPLSKLGKAMDDSVLQPSRQSRLYDFGYSTRTLGDIAEVSSISSSARRPFADNGRSHSFASDGGYNTDDDSSHNGSIMSRAKPGEGNVLFGGRQKIYKIAGSGVGSSNFIGPKGKALYDDDVSTTTFQKYRQEERQRQQERERPQQNDCKEQEPEQKSPAKPASSAPSVTGSLERQTSSSTAASGLDSRASTAATSVTSQGTPALSPTPAQTSGFNFSQPVAVQSTPNLERTATKRRLYEHGLDRDFQDHQSSAITRLNSIQKGRGYNGPGRSTPDLVQSRSGFGTQDPNARPSHPFTALNPAPSPPSTAPYTNGIAFQQQPPSPEQVSPISPSGNQAFKDSEDGVLASALNPNDRGKATAMGVFNKPQQFSESKFMERQLTLRKGRETPSNRGQMLKDSPKESEELDRADLDLLAMGADRSQSTSHNPISRSNPVSTTQRPEPPPAPTAFSVFQKAASQMKAVKPDQTESNHEPKQTSQTGQMHKFRFQDDSESDYEQDEPASQKSAAQRAPSDPRIPAVAPTVAPPQHEHPAFRSSPLPSPLEISRESTPKAQQQRGGSPREDADQLQARAGAQAIDSPLLNPTSGAGLSGLVRQHLRNVSGVSMYSNPGPTPVPDTPIFPQALQTNLTRLNHPASGNTAHSSYSNSNPWDLEDFDGSYYGETESPVSPTEASKRKDTRTSDEDYRRQALTKASEPAGSEAPWQQEMLKKSHARGGSTETQHEREAFANEIAQRQKAIQEKLKDMAQSELRSTSPTPGSSRTPGPFMGMLRQKSSRDSIKNRQEAQAKNMKMLGISGSSTNLSGLSPTLANFNDRPSGENSYDASRSRSHTETAKDGLRSPSRPADGPRSQSRAGGDVPRSQSRAAEARSHSRADQRDAPRSHSRADGGRPMMPSKQQSPYYSSQMNGSEPNSRPGTSRESEDRQRSRTNSNVNSTRSRSNSEHSNAGGRSRSRSGRYRDDLAEAMSVGTGSRTTMGYPEPSPAIPEHYQTQSNQSNQAFEFPSSAVSESLASAPRTHQNRPDPSTFEQKGLWPPPKHVGLPSPRPSPNFAPSPGFANGSGFPPSSSAQSPPLMSGRFFPGVGPMSPTSMASNGRGTPVPQFAQNPTPPMSASSTPVVAQFASTNVPMLRPRGSRKKSIQKSLISEPKLISTTSVIDTVALPPGASLSNGMDEFAPPVPPINPRRKRFGFSGRGSNELPEPSFAANQFSSHSADERDRQSRSRHRLRKTSSDGAKIGLQLRAQQQGLAMQSTPTLAPHQQSSPPRGRVEGGMF
ncbi:hypothetical protein EJ08DRAFT_405332 [Tothia fuscella]|uniref:Uncharacterized protein n=1 Tax=Tothia fuscella TaxID=1048955 RepID=A0A9P4NKW7_9PEZI|nr:hypothetical protein EJ08DRAFT_405332 [Tothia fuscella]